ncbi:MAG: oligopeptidase A [Gammaproteobacteria bacterium]|nr:oligopeptidase A [Gammaproteobacteria bacterium]
MTNPLLEFSGLPRFSVILPEHVEPAVDALLAGNRARIAALLVAPGILPPATLVRPCTSEPTAHYTWDNLIQPIEDLEERLEHAWSTVSHLNAVVNSEALRAAYNACLPKLSDYAAEMGQNARLYQAYKAIAAAPEYTALSVAQKKIIDNALRDFHLSGVDLNPDDQARYKAITQELSKLASQFEEHLLDATHGWTRHVTDPAELAGLPPTAVALARQRASQDKLDGWLFTLELPSYLPVMKYADHRALRHEMYEAYVTRASELGPNAGKWDNGPIIEKLLPLRHELAQLLGFNNYAELSLAKKMAKSSSQVMDFLNDLARRSKPMAEREFNELLEFAHAQGIEALEAWDIPYYTEKLSQHKYAISQEDLRPYFPEPRVLEGLFAILQRLYNLTVHEIKDVETWHPDVRFYEIRDGATQEVRGQFYLDLYARPHKRGGAWMAECITRKRTVAGVQTPVAYLTCNFSAPVGDDPALFTHDEVLTLFHEFGHGLHHLLTRVDYAGVAGINGVAWDAVELPSQFMENWCWEREALDLIAGHYQTGAPLPQSMLDKMLAAKNFQSGLHMIRQLEFSLFDFRLHLEFDPQQGPRVRELLEEVRAEVSVIRPPAFNRFANSFSHIFAGDYGAGYYSYKWAEVLSSDAYAKFEERGIFDRATGLHFLHTILEQGGSREPMDLFVEFRGREPTIDALLQHNGIVA